MPVLVFASSKGGVGKTTSALSVASVLAHHGVSTTLIDADPNAPLVRWAERFPDNKPTNLTVIGALGSEVAEVIDAATDPFVIVDLEGSKNVEVSVGLGRADLALIPMKGSQLDADEAASVIKLIKRQEVVFRRVVPFRVFFTQISPVIAGKGQRNIEAQLKSKGVPMLRSALMEREAFKAPFRIGGTIYGLDRSDVRNPESAVENAELFVTELKECLIEERQRANAVAQGVT